MNYTETMNHLVNPNLLAEQEIPLAENAVPFNRPAFLGDELKEMHKAIVHNAHMAGAGPYTRLCEAFLSDYYQSPVLLVTSCTHALEMAALLLELKPNDEVILPSYTFVSTANAFALRQCKIRFAECDPYGQLSLESVQRQITNKTKAICVVHYAGHSTNMEGLVALCKAHNIALIEDAAQAIGAYYKGKLLGSWGNLSCLSFHETKNITSGEGGALIINDTKYLERAHILREKGTNRQAFSQGLVDKYTWVDIGSSYVLSDMNAAYLSVQLKNMEKILTKRSQLWEEYQAKIKPLEANLNAKILETPLDNQSNYHLFAFVFNEPQLRPAFIDFMKQKGIVTPFHYVALHQSPMGKSYFSDEDFTNTNHLSRGLVRLPLFYNMTSWQQELVIRSIEDFTKYCFDNKIGRS